MPPSTARTGKPPRRKVHPPESTRGADNLPVAWLLVIAGCVGLVFLFSRFDVLSGGGGSSAGVEAAVAPTEYMAFPKGNQGYDVYEIRRSDGWRRHLGTLSREEMAELGFDFPGAKSSNRSAVEMRLDHLRNFMAKRADQTGGS